MQPAKVVERELFYAKNMQGVNIGGKGDLSMGYIVPRALALRQSIEKPKSTAPFASTLLTVAEACSALRISKWTLYRLIQRKQLKTIKIGSRRLIPLQSVEHFITQLQAEGAA
jgi:excisionase family DNA binding protein